MLPYFWYLLKVIICSGILFGYYWLFLRNKIFHQYNRFYLITAIVLSLLLPLMKINFWQQGSGTNQAINVLKAISAGDEYMGTIVITAKNSSWDFQNLYSIVYWLISFVFLLVSIRTLMIIYSLLKKYPVQQIEGVNFVNTTDDSTPFSFLKFIFWNNSIDIGTTTGRQIFKHEVAHILEKHTYDKLFVNIILIFCWCNPFFWFYRKELNMIHEFIADKKAVEDSDTAAFAAMILWATYPKHRFELTNNYFYSPIKRRLLMLTKIDNPRISYFARVMVLPLAVFLFAAFTFKAKKNESVYHGKKITVVIDAGHGGKDAGAGSADGFFEKDLTLTLAKKIKELNKNEAIDIILTREEDIYHSPQQKAVIAANKDADLLISIHIGNTAKQNTKTGIEFFVAGDQFANAEKSKGLASSLIRAFESNFPLPVSGSPLQRDMGIWIIQANNIPSVLIEAGYLTNEKDLAYLKTPAAKETIAKNVLTAIEEFASSGYISPAPVSEMKLQKITDTLPAADKADIEKALVIINGKVAGKGKKVLNQQFDLISAKTVSVKWLSKAAATLKYGKQGDDGACEIMFTEETAPTDTNVTDADKIILEKKLQELELQKEKEKLQLARLSPADSLAYKTVPENKLKGHELEKAKLDMLMEQQATLKQQYAEKLALAKVQDVNLEKTVKVRKAREQEFAELKLKLKSLEEKNNSDLAVATVDGRKLNDQEIAALKKKLILEKQANSRQQYEENLIQVNEKNNELEKELYRQKLLLVRQDDKVFTKMEVVPQFTGGQDAWRKYLKENIDPGVPLREDWKAGKYIVVVRFIVHTDGSISGITTENYQGTKTAQHCIDLIRKSPNWQPAVQNGVKVNAYRKQPITFEITEN